MVAGRILTLPPKFHEMKAGRFPHAEEQPKILMHGQ